MTEDHTLPPDGLGEAEMALDGLGEAEMALDGLGEAEMALDGLGKAEMALDGLGEAELAELACRIADELSTRGTHESFTELLRLVAYFGARVGDSARQVAAANSWSQVAELSGTSKQAAWERWRQA
jgi:hypothetical protein